ncbi:MULTISPECIES: DUF1772 domain-containing protein [Chelativorans]|jgi:hypothetical protein|uniref:DUF1772 domain-containing protein n=1 Tax=Chelativorans sp. (strain BNC1) TaxID=266779 RepID=Q11C32_CHESB|nr:MULTISPECIES: DUF1772 domain-containing protein [Chelativorans]
MPLSRSGFIFSLLTLTVMALSLGLSFAHLMEAPPRLLIWPPELWREATVFHAQFLLFGILGGPIDLSAILLGFVVTWLIGRGERRAFRLALSGSLLYLASLVIWLTVVAPANAELATWRLGPLPENFSAVRLRWETGHIIIACVKLLGFALLASATLLMRREKPR